MCLTLPALLSGVKSVTSNSLWILSQITDIEDRLSYRWQRKKEHMEWEKNGCHGVEPECMDTDTGEVRSAK